MKSRNIPLSQILHELDYEIIINANNMINSNTDYALDHLYVNDIQINSKKIKPGNMYIATQGEKADGHNFIHEAYENGAIFIVINSEKYTELNFNRLTNITIIKLKNTREFLSQIINNFYSNPSKHFKLIGVTGTNGKTSVTTIANYVFRKLNKKTGLIGTIDNYINDTILPIEKTNPTTPDCIELGKIMDIFVGEKVDIALMEVSSMALKTHRVDRCHFDIAAFTNLSPEHLDNHKTMEDYCNSKLLLFDMVNKAVINMDNEYSDRVLAGCHGNILKYGIQNPENCDIYAKNIQYTNESVSFQVVYKQNNSNRISLSSEVKPDLDNQNNITDVKSIITRELPITIKTPSEFAIYNNLAVIGICLMSGFSLEDIVPILHDDIPVEGRYDVIKTQQPFAAIIDFAHTPVALDNLLKAVRKNDTYKRIITVFGCGGDRDKSKRSVMGHISQQLSDFTIITSDNPRTENPLLILEDILDGIDQSQTDYKAIENRKEAIEYAISIAKEGDAIVIAGKGHEKVQILNGYSIEFSDKDTVLEVINSINSYK